MNAEVSFDLRVIAGQVIELLASRADEKGLELALHVKDDVPELFEGDPSRMRQVLADLVRQAIELAPNGHVFVEVEMRRALHLNGQDEARCTIAGTGDASMFSFTLPVTIGAEAVPPTQHEPSVHEAADMRVLVVDDLSINRMLLSRQLAAWGITHEVVESGPRALEALERAHLDGMPFDIALLDFMMPEMDGFELGQRIKASPLLARTSLVLLTSGSHRSEAEHFLLAGFSVFLCKPIVRQSELFDALVKAWNAQPGHPSARVPEHASAPTATALAHLTALVVEDNCVHQRLVKRMLENLGAAVDVAADGREAVLCVQRADYDVVLMDCYMPEMDGYEATAEIRRQQAERGSRRVPIIALTANALPSDRERCLAAGMDDFVGKPVRKEDIQAAFARCGLMSERTLDHTAIHA